MKFKMQDNNYLPPDSGDVCWQVGAETFTRKEVADLLWTQRSMLHNDLKRYAGKELTQTMLTIINDPRKPIF